jgi:hypothetical protein
MGKGLLGNGTKTELDSRGMVAFIRNDTVEEL